MREAAHVASSFLTRHNLQASVVALMKGEAVPHNERRRYVVGCYPEGLTDPPGWRRSRGRRSLDKEGRGCLLVELVIVPSVCCGHERKYSFYQPEWGYSRGVAA